MSQKYNLDLHTHSIISQDGGISAAQYEKLLSQDPHFCIAITDHDEISLALELRQKLGERVIVGEEITTLDGEIIGLFLQKFIAPLQTVHTTIQEIKNQGGLVYIPHPLENYRRGLKLEVLESIKKDIDIIEVFNARTLTPDVYKKVEEFAVANNIAQASSSDAHCVWGLHSALSVISEIPTRENLVTLLQAATLRRHRAPAVSFFCPSFNRSLKKFNL